MAPPPLNITRDQSGAIRVSFQTVSGYRYQLYWSSDLENWQPAGARIDGQDRISSAAFRTESAPAEFYRVAVRQIPAPVQMTLQTSAAKDFGFSFGTVAGQQYQIFASSDLNRWRVWGDPIDGSGSVLSFPSEPQTAPTLFFRVEPLEIVPIQNMVRIPMGAFMMGSPLTEPGRDVDEDPLTEVTFSHGFWMGKYEVTQREFERVMGENPSWFKDDPNCPVEYLTWKEAVAYCARLTDVEQAEGRLPSYYAYRLPTEAEFEYACRGGTTTRYSFGDDLKADELGDYAWYDGNSAGRSHPVGQKRPNPLGLHDIHGNVWEWCLDWYNAYYPGGKVSDPRGPIDGNTRVFRGGGWNYHADSCRSAFRNNVSPVRKLNRVGFRVVLAPLM